MRRFSAIVIATLLLAAVAFAQPPAAQTRPRTSRSSTISPATGPPKESRSPAPWARRQDDHDSRESKWMDGGFFVVIHSNYKSGAMGNGTGTAFMGYDPQDKVYTYDEFNSSGEAVHAKGTVDGDTWTWTNDMKMGAQTGKGRFTEKILSPTSYTFKFEMSTDGTTWTRSWTVKTTKVK